MWRHACGRAVAVFVIGFILGLAWKDIFSIEYLLLACTASTQAFMTGPLSDFIGHVSIMSASDAFQYFVGKSIGRHKAVPSISPNKTFEGYVGGIVLCNLLSPLFAKDPLDPTYLAWYNGLLFSGIIGDLAISSWKRYHVVKDTSDVLASHGGFLDRVDSHLAAFLFTVVFNRSMGRYISGPYTGTDAYRIYMSTAGVWAFVWLRFIVQKCRKPVVEEKKTRSARSRRSVKSD